MHLSNQSLADNAALPFCLVPESEVRIVLFEPVWCGA